jgi:threonine dehydrogenase-like Zn-dependent dehydrogenase
MENQNTPSALWIPEPGRAELRPTPLAALGDEAVTVRTLFSGISRGTESLIFRGGVPSSQHEVMRCPFQEGHFPGPVKYGYMNVGVIEQGRGPAAEARVGETVFCLFPHQDRYVVPADAAVALPVGLPPERAILAANMETAVNAVWDARPTVGDEVVVVGAGVVGMLIAWLCAQTAGASVRVVDPEPTRGAVAGQLGLSLDATPLRSGRADLVFHASGTPAGLVDALAEAGPEATVVEVSWFGDRSVSLPLGESFHSSRLTLRSSQVGRIPAHRATRWDHTRRMELSLRLLRDPVLEALITSESPFAELPDVMARLDDDGRTTLCHRVVYG